MTLRNGTRVLLTSTTIIAAVSFGMPAAPAGATSVGVAPAIKLDVGVERHARPTRERATAWMHWLQHPSQPALVVDLVDETRAAWPVRAASGRWKTAHVRYTMTRACRSDRSCVIVREGVFGATGWDGLTSAIPGAMNTFTSPVIILLNDSYLLTGTIRRAVVCHELGHALGLDHNHRFTSCLQPVAREPWPDHYDLIALEHRYGQRP